MNSQFFNSWHNCVVTNTIFRYYPPPPLLVGCWLLFSNTLSNNQANVIFQWPLYVYYILLMISLAFKVYVFLRHYKYVKISKDSFFSRKYSRKYSVMGLPKKRLGIFLQPCSLPINMILLRKKRTAYMDKCLKYFWFNIF